MPSEKNKSIDWRGLGNLASGDLLYYQDGNWIRLPVGSPGSYLQSQGGSLPPTWSFEDSSSSSSSSFYEPPIPESSSSSSSIFEEEMWYCVDVEPQLPGCTGPVGPIETRCMIGPVVPGQCCFDGINWYLIIAVNTGPYPDPNCLGNCPPLVCISEDSSSSSSSCFYEPPIPESSSSSSSSIFEEEMWYCVDVEPQSPGCTGSVGPIETRCMISPVVPGQCCFDGTNWYFVIGINSGPYPDPSCLGNCPSLVCIPESSSSSA